MNANLFHNILNLIGLIVGALVFYDWQALGFDAATAAQITAGVLIVDKVLKFVVNIGRDGLAGLVMRQPPVEKPVNAR